MTEIRQLQRRLDQQVLERAEVDPEWKRQLLEDPEAAMRTANFPEIQKLDEMPQSVEIPLESEVGGHVMPNPTPYSVNYYCCPFYTLAQTRLA